MPAPRLFTSLPVVSNFRIGAALEPTQNWSPHRSNAQMLAPSGSIVIPAVDPIFRPSGSLKKPAALRVHRLGEHDYRSARRYRESDSACVRHSYLTFKC